MKILHSVVAGSFLILLAAKIFDLMDESWLFVFMPLILYVSLIFAVLAAIGACVVGIKFLEERKKRMT